MVVCLFVRPSNIIVCLTVRKFYLLAVSVSDALVCVIDTCIHVCIDSAKICEYVVYVPLGSK